MPVFCMKSNNRLFYHVYIFVYFPLKGCRAWGLSSERKSDKANLTRWLSYKQIGDIAIISSDLIEGIP